MVNIYRVKADFPGLPVDTMVYYDIEYQSMKIIDACQNEIMLQQQQRGYTRTFKVWYERKYKFNYDDLISAVENVVKVDVDLKHYSMIFKEVVRAWIYQTYEKFDFDETMLQYTRNIMVRASTQRHKWFWLSDDEIEMCFLIFHHDLNKGSSEWRYKVIQKEILKSMK